MNVLERIGISDLRLLKEIKKRKLNYFGHIKRHDSLERLTMEGRMEGSRGRGRPRRRWTQDITEWMGATATNAERLAKDREMFPFAVREAMSGRDMPG